MNNFLILHFPPSPFTVLLHTSVKTCNVPAGVWAYVARSSWAPPPLANRIDSIACSALQVHVEGFVPWPPCCRWQRDERSGWVWIGRSSSIVYRSVQPLRRLSHSSPPTQSLGPLCDHWVTAVHPQQRHTPVIPIGIVFCARCRIARRVGRRFCIDTIADQVRGLQPTPCKRHKPGGRCCHRGYW